MSEGSDERGRVVLAFGAVAAVASVLDVAEFDVLSGRFYFLFIVGSCLFLFDALEFDSDRWACFCVLRFGGCVLSL